MSGSPVVDEATRLMEAVQEWLAGATGGLPIATDGVECRVCPLCQLLSLLRGSRPELLEHLGDAGSALLAAMRSVIDAHERGWAARPTTVEHIDIGE